MSRGPALASTYATAGPFLAATLRALDMRVADVIPRVLSSEDEEAVHDLRVGLRRTRTVLEIGRSVLGRFQADEVRAALRDVQRATGALRDEEVLLDLVKSLGVEGPDVEAWIAARRRRERRLRSALRRLVRSGELDRGRQMVGAMLAFRVKPSRDRRLTKFARRAVLEARRGVERREGASPEDVEALHRLRMAHKRLRYTVETFADALPNDLAALAEPAARMQGRLGTMHDVDVAVACVRRARSLSEGGRDALLAGLARARAACVGAYLDEGRAAAVATAPIRHAVGTESLRKSSIR
jgi:CHAD domain-containing protein